MSVKLRRFMLHEGMKVEILYYGVGLIHRRKRIKGVIVDIVKPKIRKKPRLPRRSGNLIYIKFDDIGDIGAIYESQIVHMRIL